MNKRWSLLPGTVAAALVLAACQPDTDTSASASGDVPATTPLDGVAQEYVRLALAMGVHDEHYVDSYFGPEEWIDQGVALYPTLESIRAAADGLLQRLTPLGSVEDGLLRRRAEGLEKRLVSLQARVDIVSGVPLSFDEETRLVFDAVAPDYDAAHFEAVLQQLDALLPGDGDLTERAGVFWDQFVIPPDRLETVFAAAIDECRRRTLERITLPPGEDFALEYVTDRPWSGYNWFQGNAFSLIQINTDLPRHIDRAIDLGCHEGYPGHHTHGTLLERELYVGRGWVEFSVYPLFSPQSLLAEGSANYGIDLAFPGRERLEFERATLFPLAGLDPGLADAYHIYLDLHRQLSYARNEAARDYLDGRISREEAVSWIQRYQLNSAEEAEQALDFIETYRAYVINYNMGRDLVRGYVEREAGADLQLRWTLFERLLSEPVSVAELSGR